jgi:hypothetical protein
MGSIREALSVLWSIVTSRWYWMIVAMAGAIVITPFLLIILIINLPPPLNFLSTILIVIAWGVAAGYKDWIIAKAKEEKQKIQQ